ncbi:MAG: hypothetical protein K6A44_00955 [bacterium]|nr:hypothetical protein [bacterium]
MKKYTKKYNIILDDMNLLDYRLRPISAISYVQDAFARYTSTKRMAAYDMMPKNLYWIVAEFNIDFVDTLPFWSEEIKVEIWYSEISKLKIYTDFNVYYNDKIFAKGNALWFLLNTETKRPAKTDEFLEKFEIVNELTLGEHKKFILPELGEKVTEMSHTTNLSDIDFNKHVNNKSYINIAEMTSPDDFLRNHTIKSLNIRFCKESFFGDTLICSEYKTAQENFLIHKIEKDGDLVCEIGSLWENGRNADKIIDFDTKVKSEV